MMHVTTMTTQASATPNDWLGLYRVNLVHNNQRERVTIPQSHKHLYNGHDLCYKPVDFFLQFQQLKRS